MRRMLEWRFGASAADQSCHLSTQHCLRSPLTYLAQFAGPDSARLDGLGVEPFLAQVSSLAVKPTADDILEETTSYRVPSRTQVAAGAVGLLVAALLTRVPLLWCGCPLHFISDFWLSFS